MDSKSDKYKKGNAAGVEGALYQIKLITRFLTHLYNNPKEYKAFRIATEMTLAKKFDDIVLEITKAGQDEVAYFLIQAKHRMDEKKTITFNELVSTANSDFTLVKYLLSYLEIVKENNFRSQIDKVIICTNVNLDKNVCDRARRIAHKDIEYVFRECQQYELSDYRELMEQVRVSAEQYKIQLLGERLVKCIVNNETLRHHDPKDIFIDYQKIVVRDVLDLKQKNFQQKFLKREGLSETTERFWDILQNAFREKLKMPMLQLSGINDFLKAQSLEVRATKKFGVVKPNESAEWPAETITDEGLEDFFNRLVFVCNTPKESEFDAKIEQELKDVLKLDDDESLKLAVHHIGNSVLNWFTATKGVCITNATVKDYIEDAVYNVNISTTLAVAENNNAILHAFNMKFCDAEFKDYLAAFLAQTEHRYFCFKSDFPQLSAVKVLSTLSDIGDSFLLVTLTDIVTPKIGKRVINTWNTSQSHNILVIECDAHAKWRQMYISFIEILKVVASPEQPEKKLLLIGNVDHPFVNEFNNNCEISFTDRTDVLSYSQLSDESKTIFLEHKIKFQGESIQLNQLMSENVASDLFGGDMMVQFMRQTVDVEIGSIFPHTESFNPDYYVPRTLERILDKVTISEQQLTDELKSHRILMIIDEPGVGKSTTTTSIAHRLKSELRDHWVLPVHLNNYTKEFKKLKDSSEQMTQQRAMDFLCNSFLKLQSNFEKSLFASHFEERGNIILLLDGFDEICPLYTAIVMSLIEALLQTKLRNIVITSRPHLDITLQQAFSGASSAVYQIKQFDRDEKKLFLIKYWTHCNFHLPCEHPLKLPAADNVSFKLELCAGPIIDNFLMLDTPLILKLMADYKTKEMFTLCLTAVDSMAIIHTLSQRYRDMNEHSVNFQMLFEDFIVQKINRYYEDKTKKDLSSSSHLTTFDKMNLEAIHEDHRLLAFRDFYKDSKRDMELTGRRQTLSNEEMAKIGLIEIIGDEIRFIHRTFADYFLADFVIRKENHIFYEVIDFLLFDMVSISREKLMVFFRNGAKPQVENDVMNYVENHNFKYVRFFLENKLGPSEFISLIESYTTYFKDHDDGTPAWAVVNEFIANDGEIIVADFRAGSKERFNQAIKVLNNLKYQHVLAYMIAKHILQSSENYPEFIFLVVKTLKFKNFVLVQKCLDWLLSSARPSSNFLEQYGMVMLQDDFRGVLLTKCLEFPNVFNFVCDCFLQIDPTGVVLWDCYIQELAQVQVFSSPPWDPDYFLNSEKYPVIQLLKDHLSNELFQKLIIYSSPGYGTILNVLQSVSCCETVVATNYLLHFLMKEVDIENQRILLFNNSNDENFFTFSAQGKCFTYVNVVNWAFRVAGDDLTSQLMIKSANGLTVLHHAARNLNVEFFKEMYQFLDREQILQVLIEAFELKDQLDMIQKITEHFLEEDFMSIMWLIAEKFAFSVDFPSAHFVFKKYEFIREKQELVFPLVRDILEYATEFPGTINKTNLFLFNEKCRGDGVCVGGCVAPKQKLLQKFKAKSVHQRMTYYVQHSAHLMDISKINLLHISNDKRFVFLKDRIEFFSSKEAFVKLRQIIKSHEAETFFYLELSKPAVRTPDESQHQQQNHSVFTIFDLIEMNNRVTTPLSFLETLNGLLSESEVQKLTALKNNRGEILYLSEEILNVADFNAASFAESFSTYMQSKNVEFDGQNFKVIEEKQEKEIQDLD